MERVLQIYSGVSRAITGEAQVNQSSCIEPLRSRYVVKKMRWKHLCMKEIQRSGSSISFEYPVFLIVEGTEPEQKEPEEFHCLFKISQNVNEYNAVANTLLWNGLRRSDKRELCNLFWSKPLKAYASLWKMPFQRVNHFPGSSAIANKSKMALHINAKTKELGEEVFSIIPETFLLPSNHEKAVSAMEADPSALWIWKPSSGSCGKGISILSHGSALPDQAKGPSVLSRYIPNPLLINGYKFDLRLYVVVTSFDPLRIYLHDDGLVRFSTKPYSNSTDSLNDLKVHLTNYSVNKQTGLFQGVFGTDGDGEEGIECNQGSKWSVQGLFDYLSKEMGVDVGVLQHNINDLIVKSLIAVENSIIKASALANCPRYSCFELYGFDVLIDQELNTWLLEVNMLPSLSSSSQLDKAVKTCLMADLFSLVRIPAVDPFRWTHSPDYCTLVQCPTTSEQRQSDLEQLKKQTILDKQYLLRNRDDQLLLMELSEEFQARKHFNRIFPVTSQSQQSKYSELFTEKRYYNILQDKFLQLDAEDQKALIH